MGGYEDKNRPFTCVACGVMRLSSPVPASSCAGIFVLQRDTVFVLFAQLYRHGCLKKITSVFRALPTCLPLKRHLESVRRFFITSLGKRFYEKVVINDGSI